MSVPDYVWVMKHPQAASIIRRTLFESDQIQVGSFEANPGSDSCGDIERRFSVAELLITN